MSASSTRSDMAGLDGAEPPVAYSLTADQLDDSLRGVMVRLPSARYHGDVEGELVGVARTGASLVARVYSQVDGSVSRYRLESSDVVHIRGPLPKLDERVGAPVED